MRLRVARKVWLGSGKATRRWYRRHPTWWHEHPHDLPPVKKSDPRYGTIRRAFLRYSQGVRRLLKANPR